MMRKAILFMLVGIMLFATVKAYQYTCTISGSTVTCSEPAMDNVWQKILNSWEKIQSVWNRVSQPTIDVWGTEYAVGENMTVWLQLLDDDKQPIRNSTCLSKVWYPDKIMWNGYRPMTYLDEGIHYLDLVAPQHYGVYPLSAMCFIPETEDFSQTYRYDDGSPSAEKQMSSGWIYAHNFTWTNPLASNIDMCAWLRIQGTPILYWTVNTSQVQLVTGATGIGQWVCNPISNLSWFNFIGDNYFGVTCTNCVGGTRAWVGQDIDGSSPPNSHFHNGISWNTDNNIYFFRLNVTDISSVNVTEYQIVMSSGEIHVSEPLTNIQTAIDNIIAFGSQTLESNHNICQDNDTLIRVLTYEHCLGARCFTYQRNETVECPRGCYEEATGEAYCIPSEISILFWIILAIVGAIIVISIVLAKGWFY